MLTDGIKKQNKKTLTSNTTQITSCANVLNPAAHNNTVNHSQGMFCLRDWWTSHPGDQNISSFFPTSHSLEWGVGSKSRREFTTHFFLRTGSLGNLNSCLPVLVELEQFGAEQPPMSAV